MIRIAIIAVGKIKEKYMREAIDDYLTRISKYAKIEVKEAPESDIQGEGEALARMLEPYTGAHSGTIVALDLHGKYVDSVELAEYFTKKTTSGTSSFAFVIGGSDGISQTVTDMADVRLKISPMTFTHQMTRLIVAEQIYRAMKINAGEKYHK